MVFEQRARSSRASCTPSPAAEQIRPFFRDAHSSTPPPRVSFMEVLSSNGLLFRGLAGTSNRPPSLTRRRSCSADRVIPLDDLCSELLGGQGAPVPEFDHVPPAAPKRPLGSTSERATRNITWQILLLCPLPLFPLRSSYPGANLRPSLDTLVSEVCVVLSFRWFFTIFSARMTRPHSFVGATAHHFVDSAQK